MVSIWWQDIVGWDSQTAARRPVAHGVDGTGRNWVTCDYPDPEGGIWRLTLTKGSEIVACSIPHEAADTGFPGSCRMPAGHRESPHVYGWDPDRIVTELVRRSICEL